MDHVKNICHLELVNLLTKLILLKIWQIQDVLNISRTRVQVQILKPCKSVQESSEEVMYFKARQIT